MQTNDFQQIVIERLDKLSADVEQNNKRIDALTQELALTNTRVDTYQKASNQVVNLAFGLIATATVTIIASVILR